MRPPGAAAAALAALFTIGCSGQDSYYIGVRLDQIIPDKYQDNATMLQQMQGLCRGSWDVRLGETPAYFSCSLPGCSLLGGQHSTPWDPQRPKTVGPLLLSAGSYTFRLQLTRCTREILDKNAGWFQHRTGPDGIPSALAAVTAEDARLQSRYISFTPQVTQYNSSAGAGGGTWIDLSIEQRFDVPLVNSSQTSLLKECGMDTDPRCIFRRPELCLGTWAGCGAIDGTSCNASLDAADKCPAGSDHHPRPGDTGAPHGCVAPVAREICPDRCSAVCIQELEKLDDNPAGCMLCTDKELGLLASGSTGCLSEGRPGLTVDPACDAGYCGAGACPAGHFCPVRVVLYSRRLSLLHRNAPTSFCQNRQFSRGRLGRLGRLG